MRWMLILALLYEDRTIEGWSVKVHSDVGPEAVRLLETRLQDIVRLVPAKAVGELRKVPIWIGGREGKGIAQYHPSRHDASPPTRLEIMSALFS